MLAEFSIETLPVAVSRTAKSPAANLTLAKSISSEPPKPLILLARFAPAEYLISPLVEAKRILPVPAPAALSSSNVPLVIVTPPV
jgi:hypothetical protein